MIVIAGIILAWGIADPAQAQPELPRPRAAPGEPKITSERLTVYGDRDFVQRFDDGNIYNVTEIKGASIAFLYRTFAGRFQDLPAQIVRVSCDINSGGIVLLESCGTVTDPSDEQSIALAIANIRGSVAGLPTYRALPQGFARLYRKVTLSLAIPAIPAPKVDLGSGQLTEYTNVEFYGNRSLAWISYPPRALGVEAEGIMSIECQIQTDLSVICRMIAFDPPEHSGQFASIPDKLTRRMRSKPMLKDGSDARGVRFPIKITWRISN
jgi:hypothetical protein